ncbi:MAG: PDZ domain-containing protein, partial [Rhodospirillaceae bacterium]
VGNMPDIEQVAANDPKPGEEPRFGMSLSSLDETLRARFRLPEDTAGVVVVEVDPSGIAAEKGIRPGDLILEVAGEKAGNPTDITKAVQQAVERKRKAVLLLVKRNGADLYVALPVRDA